MKKTKQNLIFWAIVATTILYFTWQLGRAYGQHEGQVMAYSEVSASITHAFDHYSIDTDYIITDGQYGGEWASGRCFTPRGERILLEYYQLNLP